MIQFLKLKKKTKVKMSKNIIHYIILNIALIFCFLPNVGAKEFARDKFGANSDVLKYAQNDVNNLDIIAQLKKDQEKQEKALAPDLESLGLDQIDDIPKKSPEPAKIIGSFPNVDLPSGEKVETESSKKVLTSEPAKTLPKNLPGFPNVKEGSAKNDIPESSKSNTEKKEKIKNKGSTDSRFFGLVKSKAEKVKDQVIQAKDRVIDAKDQVMKSTESFDENPDLKKVEEKEIDKVKKNPSELEIENNKKKLEEIERIKRDKIILDDLDRERRAKKLEDLRREYLQKDYNEDYEDVGHYQIISNIVPKEKVLPKFINQEVPPPLLNRIRGSENKHHPMIMSKSETVRFMFKALAENKIDDFNSLYSLVQEPNIKNLRGDTLLTFAVLMRRYAAISSLLSKGSNPDMPNDLGYTPLNIAIELSDYTEAEILVNMGANVNLVDGANGTYLMQSVRVGSLTITDLLIRNGANVNVEDRNGSTALSIAYRYRKDIIAKYLLKYNAKSWIKRGYDSEETPMIEDIFNKWK